MKHDGVALGVLILIGVCFPVLALSGSAGDTRTCTVFAATYGGKTWFGSNVDHPDTGSSLWFWPASEGQHGGVLLGYHGQVGDGLMIGYEGGTVWDTSRPDGQPKRVLDSTRARQAIGWEATTSLEEGLRKTIEWYKEHRDA